MRGEVSTPEESEGVGGVVVYFIKRRIEKPDANVNDGKPGSGV